MTTELEAWLAQTVEDPIDPELPICDPHHHFWKSFYGPPGGSYLLTDLLRDTGGGHRIVQTVFVECSAEYRTGGPESMRPVGETEWVRDITARPPGGLARNMAVAAGIVGHVDLRLGARTAEVLEAHVEAGASRFKGIRDSTAWDPHREAPPHRNPPSGLLKDSNFREEFACLRGLGLSFDAWVYHTQLAELVDLARAFPDTAIILDHIGGPLGIGPYAGKRDDVVQDWRRGISELATCPNVAVKLGGLGMPFCGFGWSERATPPTSAELAEIMSPYYLFCIEKFGVDRCMFESNFPVDKVSYPYTVLWNAFKRICSGSSPAEKAALFHDTAVRVYRL